MKGKRNVRIHCMRSSAVLVLLLAPVRADVAPGRDHRQDQLAEGGRVVARPGPQLRQERATSSYTSGSSIMIRCGSRRFNRRHRPTPASTTSTRTGTSSIRRPASGRTTSMASPFRTSTRRIRKPRPRSCGTGRSRSSRMGRPGFRTTSCGLAAAGSSGASPARPSTTTSMGVPTS